MPVQIKAAPWWAALTVWGVVNAVNVLQAAGFLSRVRTGSMAINHMLGYVMAALAVPAIVALAVLDGIATIVGLRYGKHRIFNGKSWEGTGAGIAAAFLVLLLVVPPAQALAIAVIAGLIELLAPVDDNLLIPPCICILLTVLG